jgi:hypothetical protein
MNCPVTGEIHCKCENNKNLDTFKTTITTKETLRKLFTDHAVYTKFYIECASSDLPDLKVITDRLLDNQKDIGDFIKPIVGNDNGNLVTKLLKEHILAAAGGVAALKSGNQDNIKNAVSKIFKNSEEVSKAISSLNPSGLPYDIVHKHFDEHNQYVIDIAKLHLEKKYSEEIKKYDAYYNHMLSFSDMLNNGLSKQTGGSHKSTHDNNYIKKYIKYF